MTNDWTMIGVQSALAFGNGIVTAMIVGGALPILSSFQMTTDVSCEASDLNHPCYAADDRERALIIQSGRRELAERRRSDRANPRSVAFVRI